MPLSGKDAIMAKSIVATARATCKRGAGYDKILKYPFTKTRKMAIMYRINFAFNSFQKCPRCSEVFNRSHIMRCKVTTDYLCHDPSVLNAYHSHKESITNVVPEKYNYLDAAINIQKWRVVDRVMDTFQLMFHTQHTRMRLIIKAKLMRKYSLPLPILQP
jgi:hypothetical protein